MAFRDYVSELVASVPRLSPAHAQKIINDSWRSIQDMRLWSFNIINQGQLFMPDAITSGTVTATFGSTTMQADATAKTALDAVVLANPVLASATLGVGRQIRVGSFPVNSPSGTLYNIVAYDDTTGIITIDRPYGEATGAGLNYLVYKAYYAPPLTQGSPSPKFVKYFTIVNAASGYSIRGRKLYWMQAQINAIDPQRGAIGGDPYIVAYFAPNNVGQPVHEFYPHPTTFRTLIAMFQVRWENLSTSQDLPSVTYDLADMLMYQAKIKAGEWALGNVAMYPELAAVNWVAYIAQMEKSFREERIQCIKQDDEANPLLPQLQGGLWDFPLGGEFLQSHDVSSLIPPF